MEVSGQEILTRDKVSLRVNLTALWQVTDVVKARATVSNFVDYIYKELQFALREAVGTRTLDELLGRQGRARPRGRAHRPRSSRPAVSRCVRSV